MKCIDRDCKEEAIIGLSGLCRHHWQEMLKEQKENNPEVYQENISW